jgi:hypothetical protein
MPDITTDAGGTSTGPEITDSASHPAHAKLPENRAKRAIWGVFVAAAVALLTWFWFHSPSSTPRNALLSLMPADAQAVLFVDLQDLRSTPFFSSLLAWAPKPATDVVYRQFVQDTGFDYETDLRRIALSFQKQGSQQIVFGVADGRFNSEKIRTYARKVGASHPTNSVDTFSIPIREDGSRITFKFLPENRLAFTTAPDLEALLASRNSAASAASEKDWRVRFARLAGSPLFVVISQDGLREAFSGNSAPQELARHATAGFASPQLSTLVAQLQWLTIAGKPENDGLRVIAEGESLDERQSKQLGDLVNGITILASSGLASTRSSQLNAATRKSYLALLKSVEVSQIDRGDTKSVRLVFFLASQFLQSAPIPSSAMAQPPVQTTPNPTHH